MVSQLSVVSVEGAVSLRERADTFAVSVDPFLVCLSQFGLKLISESILSVCPFISEGKRHYKINRFSSGVPVFSISLAEPSQFFSPR